MGWFSSSQDDRVKCLSCASPLGQLLRSSPGSFFLPAPWTVQVQYISGAFLHEINNFWMQKCSLPENNQLSKLPAEGKCSSNPLNSSELGRWPVAERDLRLTVPKLWYPSAMGQSLSQYHFVSLPSKNVSQYCLSVQPHLCIIRTSLLIEA